MIIDPKVVAASAAAGDLIFPYATYKPIPEATGPQIAPRVFVYHSQAGPRRTPWQALWAFINRTDINIEPTFILNGMPGADQILIQTVPADRRADVNAQANGFSGSVETQDDGYPTLATTPWSAYQVEMLAGLTAWYHLRFGIPIARPATWAGTGFGEHRLFPEWSKYIGKSCPGDARVAQIPAIFARARQLVEPPPAFPPPTPPPGDDEMPVITNAEQFFDAAPGVFKLVLMDDGRLRPLDMPEWTARGALAGHPWTNAEISAAGIWTAP